MKKAVLPLLVLAFALCFSSVNAATEAEIEQAIADGLVYLAAQQNLDGSWGSWEEVAYTGLAVKKFEHHAIHELGLNPLDPAYVYHDVVRMGLNYIFSQAVIISISSVGQAGDPDTDGDGIGVYFTSGHDTYQTGIALMAIAESDNPNTVVNVPGSAVDGWSYLDVAQDILDYLAWGQNEGPGIERGGWGYTHNYVGFSDNSNSGYAVLGLAFAESTSDGFGLSIPQFVKDELAVWIDNIQCNQPGPGSDDGGSGYEIACSWVNCLKTGNLLFEMKLVGQNVGSDPDADRAIAYLVRTWANPTADPGWQHHYQAMYCVMKGLEFQGVSGLLPLSAIDWYQDFADQIVADQHPNGSWGPDYWGDEVLSTAWALLTLERAAPPGNFCVCMDSTEVLPGHNASIRLTFCEVPLEMGGFDFLVCYDPSGLNFLSAEAVGDVADWEYFTYRFSHQDNCGGGCPTGYIRLIGIADMPNGETPPASAFQPNPGPFAELTFGTSSDLSFIGQCFHMNYCWLDCGDNTISSRDGQKAYMAVDIEDILPDLDCLDPEKVGFEPIPLIEFCHGIICIRPPCDARGDINLNGVANEISDAVLFANYFIYGPSVLHDQTLPDYFDNRELASDVNDDGDPLTVADLVYLIRIVTGDANPYPESGEGGECIKVTPLASEANVSYLVDDELVVQSQSLVDVGAAAFVFRHTGVKVGVPVLSENLDQMTLRSSDRDGKLRVLVYSMENNSIDAGAHELFTVPVSGAGTIDLAEIQYSDAKGNVLAVNTAKVSPPMTYALLQNYPNPFNAGTMIRFALPVKSDWSLRVYNVTGQLVNEFQGHSEAGFVNVHWDAANAASGIYFYKLTAKDFVATKKMILMK